MVGKVLVWYADQKVVRRAARLVQILIFVGSRLAELERASKFKALGAARVGRRSWVVQQRD